jgi:molybdopterin molybdotransferase
VGRYDFVRETLEALGATIHFHNVRVRPAKPVLFAELPRPGAPLFFLGLPGQPVSSIVALRFFFRPFLEATRGQEPEAPLLLPLAHDVSKGEGVVTFLRGTITRVDGVAHVSPHARQQPSLLGPLLESDAWIRLGPDGERRAAGQPVEVFPF